MQTKLTLRLDAGLVRKAKAYARGRRKSVSAIVADYFSTLEGVRGGAPDFGPRVRSLLGVLRSRPVDESDYRRHLDKKHR